MPLVGLLFEIRRAATLPGESVRVVGARPELGAWDPREVVSAGPQGQEADLLQLRTGALRYPCWALPEPVWVQLEDDRPDDMAARGKSPSLDSLWQPESEGDASQSDGSETSKAELPEPPGLATGCIPTVEIEYKYLKDLQQAVGDGSGRFRWEQSIGNRRVAVPAEPGAVWLVSDAMWDSDAPAQISRIAPGELVARCLELDPDYMLGDRAKRPNFCLTPGRTPGNATPPELASFEIEDEFEVLASKSLPSLLAEKLAAEKTASELAAEVLRLQREHAMQTAEREHAQEEAAALRDEVARLRGAVTDVARSAEASDAHAEAAARLKEENDRLRAELAALRAENDGVRAELAEARAAPAPEEEDADCQEDAKFLSESESVDLTAGADEPFEEPSPGRRSTGLGVQQPIRGWGRATTEEPGGVKKLEKQLFRAQTSLACAYVPTPARSRAEEAESVFLKVRSSLSSAQVQHPPAAEAESESELMKALRRRRERIESGFGS